MAENHNSQLSDKKDSQDVNCDYPVPPGIKDGAIAWREVYIEFVYRGVPLSQLTREHTGREDYPAYGTLRHKAGKGRWSERQGIEKKKADKLPIVSPEVQKEVSKAVEVLEDSGEELPAIAPRQRSKDLAKKTRELQEQLKDEYWKYSNTLPSRFATSFSESLENPELFNMRLDIAVLSARIGDLLSRVDSGESGKLWRDLRNEYRLMQEAKQRNDTDSIKFHLDKIIRMIAKGYEDTVAWDEVVKLIQTRTSLITSETKRLQVAQEADAKYRAQSLDWASKLLESVRRVVRDPETLKAILEDFQASEAEAIAVEFEEEAA